MVETHYTRDCFCCSMWSTNVSLVPHHMPVRSVQLVRAGASVVHPDSPASWWVQPERHTRNAASRSVQCRHFGGGHYQQQGTASHSSVAGPALLGCSAAGEVQAGQKCRVQAPGIHVTSKWQAGHPRVHSASCAVLVWEDQQHSMQWRLPEVQRGQKRRRWTSFQALT